MHGESIHSSPTNISWKIPFGDDMMCFCTNIGIPTGQATIQPVLQDTFDVKTQGNIYIYNM